MNPYSTELGAALIAPYTLPETHTILVVLHAASRQRLGMLHGETGDCRKVGRKSPDLRAVLLVLRVTDFLSNH